MRRVVVAPIADDDLERVGHFLNIHLNGRISGEDWARAARPSWTSDAPNHGFMLLDDVEIVGVYLAYYSGRLIAGKLERFCNLGPWCVLPEHRFNSVRLLATLLAQPGYHFTDLSPSGNVVPLNERLGFVHLDTTSVLMLNVPWPTISSRARVISNRRRIEGILNDRELRLLRDHSQAWAAGHVVLTQGGEHCYVIFRRDRRKGLPLFASVLYVSNPWLFRRMARAFGGHLLISYRVPITIMELRVVGERPAGTIPLREARPRMFKSDYLAHDQIDYLYSELTSIAW